MMNEDPLMDDEQAGDAVARYLEENPELLQGIVPTHDLWPAIESRISARVIPMSTQTLRRVRRTTGWIPTLIAASALIAGTAGITYILTTRADRSFGPSAVASSSTAATGARSASNAVAPDQQQPSPADRQGASTEPQPGQTASAAVVGGARGIVPLTTQVQRPAAQLASHSSDGNRDEVRATYDSEIASLKLALDSRRSHLNPATVAVIEQNLGVIDEAIRQSRAALARDPNSRLLNNQLDRTLATKTGLLRAAVLLPAA